MTALPLANSLILVQIAAKARRPMRAFCCEQTKARKSPERD